MSANDVIVIPSSGKNKKNSGTFVDNMSLPVHRWFRYTAGFSAAWVNELLRQEKELGRINVIDPFAGSGTVLLESEKEQMYSFGLEAHPYVFRIAAAKLNWQMQVDSFERHAGNLLEHAKHLVIPAKEYPRLIAACYPPATIAKLEALKQSWLASADSEESKSMSWLVITSMLRTCSPVGTAQWQYVLPNKSKRKAIDPWDAFEKKVSEMIHDMRFLQKTESVTRKGIIVNEDARNITSIPGGWGDLVITSPPYANNYDYADATRLEMTFWGDISGWGDLQDGVRKYLVRACTQHVAGLGKSIDEIMANQNLSVIQDDLWNVYKQLSEVRLTKGGKKNYHFMIAAYFNDLSNVLHSLRKVTARNVKMCWVVGDSAPYGVYVPVDRWLGEIAQHVGFGDFHFEKLRDRNVKWKNRKHDVPLHEGRLWING